jgi:NADP-dependent 3-hydroxy acid dehydrogenase YdfG
MLARELVARGHTVRGTTRNPDRLDAIEAAGAQPVLADPDRVATMVRAFEHVAVACLLLGSASGSDEQLSALHGERLDMALSKIVDTTIHGVVYESRGTVDEQLLRAGADRVRAFSEDTRAAYRLLEADPSDTQAWLEAATDAVERVLGGR